MQKWSTFADIYFNQFDLICKCMQIKIMKEKITYLLDPKLDPILGNSSIFFVKLNRFYVSKDKKGSKTLMDKMITFFFSKRFLV